MFITYTFIIRANYNNLKSEGNLYFEIDKIILI